jgi:hydrogenase maturation protease
MSVKIIGIGSPFGQDQLGWLVIDHLNDTLTTREKIEIELIKADRPGLGLLELLKNTDTAILIDAIDDKQHVGQIKVLTEQELFCQDTSLSSHALGVSDALRLGHALGDLPDAIVLIGICIDIENSSLTKQYIERLSHMTSQILNNSSLPAGVPHNVQSTILEG